MTGPQDDRVTKPDDDAELRAAFAALRKEDAANVPVFEAVLAAAARAAIQRRRPWLLPTLTGTIAAAALVVAMIAVTRGPEAPLPPVASIEQWTAPTDFLLDTPGRDLLDTVPRIGELPQVEMIEPTRESGSERKRRSVSP